MHKSASGSESPKVLGLLLWAFKPPRPKVRKCSGCCCGCSNGHVRKSESARAVVVGVQTATSESPKVLHFWHFRTFGPEQIRESKSLLFQIQIWHFRHFRTRADSGVQISIVKDCGARARTLWSRLRGDLARLGEELVEELGEDHLLARPRRHPEHDLAHLVLQHRLKRGRGGP